MKNTDINTCHSLLFQITPLLQVIFNHTLHLRDAQPSMVVHAFNTSTGEAKEGRYLSSKPACSLEQGPAQPALHREPQSVSAGREGEKGRKGEKETLTRKICSAGNSVPYLRVPYNYYHFNNSTTCSFKKS